MNDKPSPDVMPEGYGELTFGAPKSLVIDTMEKAWRLATLVMRAKLNPAGLDNVEAICIALLHGAEVGLPPMMSIQRIAVIGGRPTIWGDAALSIVMNSGLLEEIDEVIEGEGDNRVAFCTVKRKGFKARTSSYSVEDAKTAGLWDDRATVRRKAKYDGWFGGKQVKAGEWTEMPNDAPWRRNPNRMLQMRARGFGLRDNFADVLGGMYLREEFTGTTIEGELAPQPPSPRGVGGPPPPPPEEQSVGDNTMPPPEYQDDGPPPPPNETPDNGPPVPPGGHLNATEANLLVSAYAARLQEINTEEGLDMLWVEVIGPYIDADRVSDGTLTALQTLDDERRGVIQSAA
jgi:hypothetical protein